MPLTQEQENREHELRVDQMTVNIEKMRKDMRYESRKFILQIVATIAVSIGAGVALTNWVNSRSAMAPASAVQTAPPQAVPRG